MAVRNNKDDRSEDDDTFLEKLSQTLEESFSKHASTWMDDLDELAKKFDSLQEAYSQLVARLTHVEAKDFNAVVKKTDCSLQKIIALEQQSKNLDEITKSNQNNILLLKEKIDRANLIINIICGVFVSVLVPFLIGIIPIIYEHFRNRAPIP